MEQDTQCAQGLKIKTFGAVSKPLDMLSSAAGRILVKIRNMETLHFKAGHTEAKKKKVADPRLYNKCWIPASNSRPSLSHYNPLSI